jgi:hypothetical protein
VVGVTWLAAGVGLAAGDCAQAANNIEPINSISRPLSGLIKGLFIHMR